MREQPATHGHQLGRVGPEVGEAVGGLQHELGVVARVPGECAQTLEREHQTPSFASSPRLASIRG